MNLLLQAGYSISSLDADQIKLMSPFRPATPSIGRHRLPLQIGRITKGARCRDMI